MPRLDFAALRLHEREPVYQQLVTYVKRCVASGEAADGESLPSRRELAALLGINPNTAHKAYRLLEDEGFIQTPRNASSRLCVTQELKERAKEELSHAFVRAFIAQARENRLSRERLIALIDQHWEDGE